MSIDQAISVCGGLANLSAAIGVPSQNVWNWRKRRVPAEHCPAIEKATGGEVRCEDLRPDIDWAVLRRPCRDESAHDELSQTDNEMQAEAA